MSSPRDEYDGRLAARKQTHARLSALDRNYSYARLTVFAAAALLVLAVLRPRALWIVDFQIWISPWWLVVPAAAFGWLIVRHDRVIHARDAAARAIAFYERGLARIDDRWVGTGDPGERFQDDRHLYANDLDLFGRGSLFELLSIARTRAGEETLASWLKAPADPDTVRARQRAIDEMAPRLDLRERLALAGTEVRAGVHTEALIAWASAPILLQAQWPRIVAAVLAVAAASAVARWAATGQPDYFVLVVAAEAVFFFPIRARVLHVLHGSERPVRDLDVLAHVLERLERDTFEASRLAELRASLDTAGVPASTAIRRMHMLSEMHSWQHNQFFAPIAAALLWGTQAAFAMEAWRRHHGAHVAGWLAVVGEFEAFGSLSAYRYEHPQDPFPEIIDIGGANPLGSRDERRAPLGIFTGIALGHPLLAAARAVRNDVHLSDGLRLLVVSGSNMSGKSTLLRTVGINSVLALMGAPVRATRLRLTPLAIGATLRIQDSLQEGRSRFYAEITRLRELADVANGPLPLLFLLDELFHGTNSHDRLVGATGVLRSLIDCGAIGLVTTHDLALTRIADDLAPRAANVHFEDTFEAGEIRFDYRMRPGPVTRSNALALMRAVGLAVDEGDDGV